MTASGSRATVLVELTAPPVTAPLAGLDLGAALPGFTRDPDFDPVVMSPGGSGATVVVRGTVEGDDVDAAMAEIERQPGVVRVWTEGRTAPFA